MKAVILISKPKYKTSMWERKYKVINKHDVKSGILASDFTHQFEKNKNNKYNKT